MQIETDPPPAPPAPPAEWESLGLSADSLALIKKAGFSHPTSIQTLSIPIALKGKDLVASSQTGSGKTASFVLPMVERFQGREGTYGLILAPTREIAQQTQATLEIFATPRGVRSAVLIGGVDMRYDTKALDSYPQIIVATPGRLCDHLDRGNIWLDYIEMLVLDEADRMLDMGFSDQLARITSDLPKSRQTLLFSATIPPPVKKLADRILHEPEQVVIGKPLGANRNIEQSGIFMKEESKNRELRRVLREEKGSIIVFTRSKDGATRVWRTLHSAGIYDATFIHSDRAQKDREMALAEFKEGKYRVLIATDVAARGIHVDGVALVVNYDLPMEPEDYIHRIGRTGRVNAQGRAITFITPRDRTIIGRIERLLGHSIAISGEPAHEPTGSDRRPEPRRPEPRRSEPRTAEGPRPKIIVSPVSQTSAAQDPEQGQAPKRRRRRGKRGSGPGSPSQPPQT